MVRQTVTSDDTSQRNSEYWKQERTKYRALGDPTCQQSVFWQLFWYANSLTPVSEIALHPPQTISCNVDPVLECVKQDAIVDIYSAKWSAQVEKKECCSFAFVDNVQDMILKF